MGDTILSNTVNGYFHGAIPAENIATVPFAGRLLTIRRQVIKSRSFRVCWGGKRFVECRACHWQQIASAFVFELNLLRTRPEIAINRSARDVNEHSAVPGLSRPTPFGVQREIFEFSVGLQIADRFSGYREHVVVDVVATRGERNVFGCD